MNASGWVRICVLLGIAVYLTFGRAPTLPFVYGEYMNWVDYTLNYGVATLAVLAAIPGLISRLNTDWTVRMIPFALLFGWISLGVLRGDMDTIQGRSYLFNLAVAVLLGSQLTREDVPMLRRLVMVLAAVFALLCLTYGGETLSLIRNGWVKGRLGTRISAGNGVVLPRIMFIFVFSAIATFMLDRRQAIKLLAIPLAGIPLMIAFATGGRGPLLAVILATLTLMVFASRGSKLGKIWALIITGIIGVVGVAVASDFRQLTDRLTIEASASSRLTIWRNVLSDGVSLFGRGASPDSGYAHNVFLEMLQDYGLIGLGLFTLFLGLSLRRLWHCYQMTRDRELLWIAGLLILQLVAQQFSLHIFFPFFWTALALPLGLEMRPAGFVEPSRSRNVYGQPDYPRQFAGAME